jgi:hypothetical protein
LQVTIVLDSGLFLTDEEGNGYTESEVGYFTPHIVIYRDSRKNEEIDAANVGTNGRVINVRKFDANGQEVGGGVNFSDCLITYLFRAHKLYGEQVEFDRPDLDCIFHFNSGKFCSSKVKQRDFKEFDGADQPTGRKQSVEPIAHDVVIHYELAPGEKLRLVADDGGKVWYSDDHPTNKRIDVEILADNTTATKFYRDGLKMKGKNHWLPNQGDPPPLWTHRNQDSGGGNG